MITIQRRYLFIFLILIQANRTFLNLTLLIKLALLQRIDLLRNLLLMLIRSPQLSRRREQKEKHECNHKQQEYECYQYRLNVIANQVHPKHCQELPARIRRLTREDNHAVHHRQREDVQLEHVGKEKHARRVFNQCLSHANHGVLTRKHFELLQWMEESLEFPK